MDENRILTELGIDPNLSIAEIKQALEKKKQGLLRKLNAVFGNPTKEQELNRQLEQVEELIVHMGVRQVIEAEHVRDDRSALLSNVKNTGTFRLDQFHVETRELSQTEAKIAAPESDLQIEKQALEAALECMRANDMDGAYEAVCDLDPEKYPYIYAVLGSAYDTKNCTYYNLEKAFNAYKRGAECEVYACYKPLANAYRYGIGTAVNTDCAIQWLQKASEVDPDAGAERALGELYGQLGKYQEMFIWYQLGMYEHNDWQSRIDLASAILKYDLGIYYTEKALDMLRSELELAEETKDLHRRAAAYRGLLNYYSKMEKQNTRYRKNLLEVSTALAEENLIPCASTVAYMHLIGYAAKPNYAEALKFYELAQANGESFDQTEMEKAKRIVRKEEKLKRANDRVFAADDAEKLVNETRKNRSDILRIPEGYTKIDYNSFEQYKGKGLLKKAFFSEVVLPQSLIVIEPSVFHGLKGLKRFNLPQNIAEIGRYAFWTDHAGCEQLTVPGDVTGIPFWAFYGCDFGTVRVDEGVEKIGESAFAFSHIKHLELPSTLKRIETNSDNGAFRYATIGSLRAPIELKEQIERQEGLKLDPKNIIYYE